MIAAQIRQSLALRWPDTEYLTIPEAPQDASRQGRKIDLLAVSLWRSRGFNLDAVEIKVSLSDWKREVVNAAKADWWWRHTNRFWVAVPADLAEKVKPDLPPTWGLLAVADADTKPAVVVAAEHRAAEPMEWVHCIGLMRASADAGFAALQRAETRGRQAGYRQGKAEAERGTPGAELEELRAKIAEFKAVSGVDLDETWRWGDIGQAVAVVQKWAPNPEWALNDLDRLSRRLDQQAKDLRAMVKDAGKALGLSAAKEAS